MLTYLDFFLANISSLQFRLSNAQWRPYENTQKQKLIAHYSEQPEGVEKPLSTSLLSYPALGQNKLAPRQKAATVPNFPR